MNPLLLRITVLVAAFAWPTLAHCIAGSLGFYSIRTDVSGEALAGAGDHRAESPLAAAHPATFSFSREIAASVENAGGFGHAVGDLTWAVEPGRLRIFADALADARINPLHGRNVASGAETDVFAEIEDDWSLMTDHPVRTGTSMPCSGLTATSRRPSMA